MATHEFGSGDQSLGPIQYGEQMLEKSRNLLFDAVGVVSPENPDLDPQDVFPAPTAERRADDPGMQLTPAQETELRRIAAELGFGRKTDLRVSELGLVSPVVVVEAGQPHKVQAELEMVLSDKSLGNVAAYVMLGSPERKITDAAEIEMAQKLLGSSGETELDNVTSAVVLSPSFTGLGSDEAMSYGYEYVNGAYVLKSEVTGQFVHIGYIDGAPVILLSVDRTYDEADPTKYRQPGAADITALVAQMTANGGHDEPPIAFVTSSTYQASRSVDVIRAALELGTDRPVGVASYGTERLAAVKGVPVEEPSIKQLPGELHKLAVNTRRLADLLQR